MGGRQRGDQLCDAMIDLVDFPAIVIASFTHRRDTRFARTQLTTNGDVDSWQVTIVAMPEGHGVASATVTDVWVDDANSSKPNTQTLAAAARRAHALALQSTPAPDASPLLEQESPHASGDHWNAPSGWAEESREDNTFTDLGLMFDRARTHKVALFGYAEQLSETHWLATTSGRRGRSDERSARFECTARHGTPTRSNWWGGSAAHLADIPITESFELLMTGLRHQAKRRHLAPGNHRVLLSPSAVGDLMVDLWWAMLAVDAVEGRSVFSGIDGQLRLGEQFGPQGLRLTSDPADPLVPASNLHLVSTSSAAASVFDNGAKIESVDWFRDGVLTSMMSDRRFSRDHDLPFTPAADTLALYVDAGHGSLGNLIARTEHAYLINCLWYNRLVDPGQLLITGLTRDGVYEVRDGEIIGAVDNFRFLQSPVKMLASIRDSSHTSRTLPREMGDYAPRVAMPALLVDDFNLNSTSAAQ